MSVGEPGNLTLACCSLSCFRWIGLRKLLYNIFLEQKNIINMFLRLLHSLGPVPIQFRIHLTNKLFAAKSPSPFHFLYKHLHMVYMQMLTGVSRCFVQITIPTPAPVVICFVTHGAHHEDNLWEISRLRIFRPSANLKTVRN